MPSVTEQILKKCHENLVAFGQTFNPGDFRKLPTPPMHHVIGKKLMEKTNRPLAIVIHRDAAKSTYVRTFILNKIVYAANAKKWGFSEVEDKLFYGWISQTQAKSKENVRFIAKHIEHNKIIRKYFGNLSGRYTNGLSWGAEMLEFTNDCKLKSASNLSSIRGETMGTIDEGAKRYDGVFADDIESEDNTRTPQARDQIFRMLMDGIFPAIDKRTGRLYYIGTPVNFDSFGNHMIRLKMNAERKGIKTEWDVMVQPLTNPDGSRTWPEKFTDEEIEKIKRIYSESPKGVRGFYQEYELQVQSEENALFTRKHIQYHNYKFVIRDNINMLVDDKEGIEIPVNTFIGSDPATDIMSLTADYSVIMVIAVDTDMNIYVLHIESHMGAPSRALRDKKGTIIGKKGVVDYIFDLYEEYNAENGKVEDVAMVRSVWQGMEQEKIRRNKFDYSIIPIKPGGKEKRNKIYTGLSGYLSSLKVYIRDTMYELERQVLMLGPMMGKDDEVETLYFSTQFIYPPSGAVKTEGRWERKVIANESDWQTG